MAIPSSFLLENNPRQNIDMLASIRPSDTSGTKCTTQRAYAFVPKTNLKPSTLREISLVSSSLVVFSAPFLFTVRKAVTCSGLLVNTGFKEAKECAGKLVQAFADPVNAMAYLCFVSAVAIAGTATYAGARYYFQDSNQEKRFEALNKEYSATAEFLVKEYGSARKVEREALVEAAQKLIRNGELIRSSLSTVARLTEPQVNLLTAKITHAAKEVLRLEKNPPAIEKPKSSLFSFKNTAAAAG